MTCLFLSVTTQLVAHGILSGKAIDVINNSVIEKMVITNTIPLEEI